MLKKCFIWIFYGLGILIHKLDKFMGDAVLDISILPNMAEHTNAAVVLYNNTVKELYGDLSAEQKKQADAANQEMDTVFKLAQRGMVPDNPWPQSKFTDAFGKGGEAVYNAYQSIIQVGSDIRDLPRMTPEQQTATLDKYKINPNDRESARNNLANLDALQRAMKQDQDARE